MQFDVRDFECQNKYMVIANYKYRWV